MTEIEASTLVWLVTAVVALCLNLFGLCLFSRLKRKKVSDYLLMHLSIMGTLKEMFRASFMVYMLTRGTHTRTRIQKTGIAILVIGEYISVLLITLDRVLKVKLSIKYSVVVTNKGIPVAFLSCWAICIGHGVVVWFYSHFLNKMLSLWALALSIIMIICYSYIFIYIKIAYKKLSRTNSVEGKRRTLNLKVPFLIVTTFIILIAIPNLLLAMHAISFSPWLYTVFTLNTASGAAIYILGTPKLWSGMCCLGGRQIQSNRGSVSFKVDSTSNNKISRAWCKSVI